MTATQPLTASAFLFDGQDTGPALARALDEQGVLGSLDSVLGGARRPSRPPATGRRRADGVLALDLGDLRSRVAQSGPLRRRRTHRPPTPHL